MALLEFKSWPGLDEGIFESYVHLNIVVPGLLYILNTHEEIIIVQKYTIENSKIYSHGPSFNPNFVTFGDLSSISNQFSSRDTVKARIQSDPTGSKHKLSSSCPIRWWYTVLVLL